MAARHQHKLLHAGVRAPDFRLPRLDGGEAAIRELIAASPVLLAFFKVTCPVCQFTLPFLDRIHSPGRLPIYGISQNDAGDTRDFKGEFGVRLPTLLDSEEDGFPVSNAFGISSVPTMFLIEPDGTVSRVMEGWNKKEIEWLGGRAGVHPFRPGENVPAWKAG
ncbi:MAG TPA: TlpA disulfide reductase family protein [Bryobacteraceae bacterium]|nr:TlpA disulfide reductase family protein [Bryobacteraceae bacterium]